MLRFEIALSRLAMNTCYPQFYNKFAIAGRWPMPMAVAKKGHS
jgi:hypothetical protein